MLIGATPVANLPWEEPADRSVPLWRYSRNPVITRNAAKDANSIFNSAVVPFEGGFAGVFRCDDIARRMDIRVGRSSDGLTWKIADEPIAFMGHPGQPASEYKYDPRVIPLEGRWYVMWCDGNHGASIGLGVTDDFRRFERLENPLMPFNRNGVLFPRRINGRYAMLSRPSDSGHTPFGDIFYSESPDLTFWGRHRHVMGTCGSESPWQSTKIGPGPSPIETKEGWLLLYHGVLTSCNGFVYSMSAALLDLDEPWKVIARARPYLLNPRETYECVGDVPNVVFPCASVVDAASGRVAVYYGCADTATSLAFGYVDELVDWVKRNAL